MLRSLATDIQKGEISFKKENRSDAELPDLCEQTREGQGDDDWSLRLYGLLYPNCKRMLAHKHTGS